MRKMCNATKELQALRKERDGLLKRVEELACHEGQYKALQCKLRRVEAVIAENEVLNNKLLALDKLEKENEYLRCRLDQIQEMEMNAIEDKERILQLQCVVADQEEEMKDLLSQIERLTNGVSAPETDAFVKFGRSGVDSRRTTRTHSAINRSLRRIRAF